MFYKSLFSLIFITTLFIGVVHHAKARNSDPTKPKNPISKGLDERQHHSNSIHVTAILFRHEQYIAVINGNIVRQGEYVENWLINQINTDSVLMTNKNEPGNTPTIFMINDKRGFEKNVSEKL